MLQGFDHLIYLAHDLDAGAAHFAGLGFALTMRADVEPSATENRLVCFADGSYIEIVRFRDPAQLASHRFAPLADTGGWAEFVLRTDGLTALHAGIAGAGLPTSPVREVRKTLANGLQWSVLLSHFGRGVGSPLMPMLAEDRTTHNLRVPDQAVVHANGALGIGGVTLASGNLEQACPLLQSVFGLPVAISADRARFTMGERWVDVIAGTQADDHLRQHGEGIYSISIDCGGTLMELPNPARRAGLSQPFLQLQA